ncbi:MAG: hypothetical protein ACOYNC_15930 [Bacteroidales bacterium]
MKKTSIYAVLVSFLLASLAVCAQNAMEQPGCLLQSDKVVRIDTMISAGKNCRPAGKSKWPWIVYSNRGDDFGRKYYVVGENLQQFLIYSGTGTSGLSIQNGQKIGWRAKTNYLFHFSADFTRSAMIHRKCVVLNSQGLVDSICMGLMEESRIPVYSSPVEKETREFLPLYSIYFIYQAEGNRYLLGKDYVYLPESPFHSQIIGWVDKNRVFSWDNRLCFEPDFQSGSVRKRRCDTVFGNAKVFSTPEELGVFLSNRKANIDPLWEEPDYFCLPANFENQVRSGTMKIGQLREILRSRPLDEFSFPNKPGDTRLFRFPFLGFRKDNRKVLEIAATGKYLRSRQSICDSLAMNKRKLNVFFIIPDSFQNAYSVFFLNQLNSKYTSFTKTYNACYYPGNIGEFALLSKSVSGQNTYNALLDSMMNHKPTGGNPDEINCLESLNHVLGAGSFNNQETNLIVLVSTTKSVFVQQNYYRTISAKLALNNCYLLTFDLANNPSFTTSVEDIMQNAIGIFNQSNDLNPISVDWDQKGKCKVLTNYLLAATWAIDTTGLKGPQILEYIQDSYDPVISTITRAVNAQCNSGADTIELTPNETAYRQGLEKFVPGCRKSISYMRILQKGFIRMKYLETNRANDPVNNVWQAELLMTQEELVSLTQAIDGITGGNTAFNLCQGVCELWQKIITRFVGEEIVITNQYLQLTIPQVLDLMIGVQVGYSDNEEIKRYSFMDICACQDEVAVAVQTYQGTLNTKNQRLKSILHAPAFSIPRENEMTTNIKYYWVPVSLLP